MGLFCAPARTQEQPAAFQDPDIMAHVRAIAALGVRRPGTPGAAATRDYITAQLKEYGIKDIRLENVPVTCWEPREWSLETMDRRGTWLQYPSFWMPLSPATGLDGVEGNPIYVGEGADISDYDIAGRVVIFDQVFGRLPASEVPGGFYDPDATLEARRRDALVASLKNLDHIFETAEKKQPAALVGLLTDFPYNADTFFAQPRPGGSRPPVPMLWVPRDAAVDLRLLALQKHIKSIRVVSLADETECTDKNVVAFVPGRTDRWLMVHAHYDAPFDGAVQDATGVAEVLALARHFTAPGAPRLDHGLIFFLSAAHVQGRLGARQFITDHPDLLKKIDLDITLEHVGRDCREKGDALVCSDLPAPRLALTANLDARTAAALDQIIRGHNLIRTATVPQTALSSLSGDSYFRGEGGENASAGVPSIDLLSAPPYLFSREDTPDMVAEDQLAPLAEAVADLLLRIDK